MDIDDALAWDYDSNGLFSVRSAYKVQRAHIQLTSQRGDTSSVQGVIRDENQEATVGD